MSFPTVPRLYKALAVIFLSAVVMGLCFLLYIKGSPQVQPQFATVPTDKETLFLFLPASNGGLRKHPIEVRGTLSERSKADILFGELRKAKAIPASAKLRELAFGESGVLYLDVSHDLMVQQLDAKGEIQIVYALVNSFIASFKDVTRVQLLVDGRPVHTFFGIVYTYAPLPFNNDLQEE